MIGRLTSYPPAEARLTALHWKIGRLTRQANIMFETMGIITVANENDCTYCN